MTKHLEQYLETINPKHGKLLTDKEGTIHTIIIDAELDGFKCVFNNDSCVEINTKKYNSLTLSRENLFQLIDLIDKADKKYEKRSKADWDKYEKVSSKS
jgi:hypothetical protein